MLKNMATPFKRPEKFIVIDERIDHLDERVIRTIIGAVELDDPAHLQQVKTALENYVKAKKIPKNGQKLHINELDFTEKLELITFISTLNFSAKVYVNYDYSKQSGEAKIHALKFSVAALQQKHRSKKLNIMIEHADEYKKVVKAEFMTSDHYLSLVPDVVCHLIAYRLDINSLDDAKSKLYEKMYLQLREHVRLHTYRLQENTFEEIRSIRL